MNLAIVQARMSSTRLPGKVMKEILGKPLIGYLFERLKLSKRIDKVVLATSEDAVNDSLCDYVQEIGIPVYRGNEDDVLDRFYCAAKPYNSQAIVRVTGDCPLIDPCICDQAIDTYIKESVDYVHTGPDFAEGIDCEVFSFKVLEEAWKKAVLNSEREHVTRYFHNHPESFKKIILDNQGDDSRYRITVDEKEDFLVVKAIIETLYNESTPLFTISEIKKFLDARPDIFKLNSHIIRNEGLLKSLKKDSTINV